MISPKEKALELVDKFTFASIYFTNGTDGSKLNAKTCALIAVDEIIEIEKLDYLFSKKEINSMEFTSDSMWIYERFTKYWQEVKKEINKL